MKSRFVALLLLALVALQVLQGQTVPVNFEAASVKPSPPSDVHVWQITGGPGTNSPTQFLSSNAPLRALLLEAYDLQPNQLVGPVSLDNDKFDIAAKIPAGSTKSQIHAMLQNLLAERIGLVTHMESRDLPGYELVVAKSGLKMKPAEVAPPGESAAAPPGPPKVSIGADGLPDLAPGKPMWTALSEIPNVRIIARMQTSADIAKLLERRLRQPVTDKTGLPGTYDYKLFFAPDPAKTLPPPPPDGASPEQSSVSARDPVPDLPNAVEAQLGLKLLQTKTAGSVLVVDRYNRTPGPN